MFSENNVDGLVYMTSDAIPHTHAFTTREGGVSEGAYSSLNLAQNSGDDPGNLRENYRLLCEALSINPEKLVFSRQVHKAEVKTVSSADARGLFSPAPYEADALATDERGLVLMVFTADCVPVLLSDPAGGVIASAHCGWRSSCADILGNVVKKMTGLGASPENIRAAVGPAIGECCFETGEDVPRAILGWLGPGGERFFKPRAGKKGKYLCDLKSANRERLLRLGLKEENIDISGDCTMCESEKYWSHRVTKGIRGGMAGIIVL